MKHKLKLSISICFIALTLVLTAKMQTSKAIENTHTLKTASGAELFKNNCARCHGNDGTGGKGPDLTSEKRQNKWKGSDEKIVSKITKGGYFMPSF